MRLHWMFVAILALAWTQTACGGDEAADGPGTIKNVEKDVAAADISGTRDEDASVDSSDALDSIQSADIVPTSCIEDKECADLEVPLCNAPKCLDGKCGALPTAEGVGCDDGNACTTGDLCQGGLCSGVLNACDDGDVCTDDVCAADTGKCGHLPLAAGVVQVCEDGDPCTKGDKCVEGKCVGGESSCDDGNPCTDDSCDTEGACVHTNNTKPCLSGKCVLPGQCKGGECKPGTALVCDDKNSCTADSCDDKTGFCVYSPKTGGSCDDGDKCTNGESCKAGKCQGGESKPCSGGSVCAPMACNPETGLCVATPKTGGDCDDGDKCTSKDVCKGGVCVGGSLLNCQDSNPCTDDLCDPKTGCMSKPNTADCSDDKLCKMGVCAAGKCVIGNASGCNDNNPCTIDTCVDSKGCVYKSTKDGAICGPKDACQEDSICKAGKCLVGAKVDCSDGNPCTDDKCSKTGGCVWEANEAPCEDGDVCTKGDKCLNGKCTKGVDVDPAEACDDKNVCTKDSCEPKKGCVHNVLSGPCDDGDVCTAVESCLGGKCVATKNKCEDTGPCMAAACEPKTGKCSWSSKVGPCDDGDGCTSGDHCDKGKCVSSGVTDCDDKNSCTKDSCSKGKCQHGPVSGGLACDDGDKCTSKDVCQSGKCVGTGGPVCDDGNVCTTDSCNPLSGKCTFKPFSGPCDDTDLCTSGDTCNNGKCQAGTVQVCDDKSPCTVDSCDSKTGKCSYKPTNDGMSCDDGKACSTGDACKAGACVPSDVSKCALFYDLFDCAKKGAGWKLDKPSGKKVIWLVDKSPLVGGEATHGCSLNFNDGVDYCDKKGNGCQTPTGYATSSTIDATKVKVPVVVRFRTYMDLDSTQYSDRPFVVALDESGKSLWSHELQKSNKKKWIDVELEVDVLKGKKFRLRFGLYKPSGYSGNSGKGWFVDDLWVEALKPKELCEDGVDNDGNGLTDCFDPVCKGSPECQITVFSRNFKCGEAGWVYVDTKRNGVAFGIDAKPSVPKALIEGCTLNFNNGTNFCGYKGCKSASDVNGTAGMATWGSMIDGGGYKKLWAVYWSWIDAEPDAGNSQYYDRGWLQVSVDNYKGCCGATVKCGNQLNTCNTLGTNTWMIPRKVSDQKKWRKVTVDLSKFAGKKFSLRFRFNSGDGHSNETSGWFIDKLRVYGQK